MYVIFNNVIFNNNKIFCNTNFLAFSYDRFLLFYKHVCKQQDSEFGRNFSLFSLFFPSLVTRNVENLEAVFETKLRISLCGRKRWLCVTLKFNDNCSKLRKWRKLPPSNKTLFSFQKSLKEYYTFESFEFNDKNSKNQNLFKNTQENFR